MSKFLQRLHKEVLDKFPFSISGYNSPDKEYEEFFHKICKFQESLEEDNKIHFTISGFAKLQTTSNLSEAELDKWKTESLKYLLFNDNYLGFSEPILSLYIALLQLLSADKRVVNILAENVNNSILIKILLNEKLDKIHFSFIKSDNTLLIEVPLSYFKSVKDGRKDSLQDLLKDIDYEKDLIVKREGSSSSYSIVLTDGKTKKFNSILKSLLDINTIVTIQKHPPENVYDKLLKEVLKNEKYNAKEIYSLIFASAILCYFYDCSLTYFVSTARVANNKRYTLGAMGIGLKAGNDLTDNDKALYSILVNHLAANLSTQLIFESNKHLQRENNKVNLREALNKIKKLNAQVLHGEVKTGSDFDNAFSEIQNEHSGLLTEYFSSSYNKLKSGNCSHISKYCLVELKNSGDCGKCNITERPKLFKNNSGEKCCSSIGNMELINVPFIEALFEKLTTSEKKNIATVEDAHVTDDNEIVFSINYSNGFDVKTFTEKLKESHNGSLIGEFFIKQFQALDCHGVFKMIDLSSDKEFFNSRETIQGVNLTENKIIINEHYLFPNIQSVNKIKIVSKMSSKINIILWGVSGIATPQEKKSLRALGSPLTVLEDKEKVAVKLSDADLIIAHDGLPNSFRKSDNVWLLQTGGGKDDKTPTTITQTGTISWNTFMENIAVFVSQLRSNIEIKKEDIEILYAIDPKVEGLLEKLSVAVPFEDLWNTTLRNTKHDLQKEIKRKLA